MRGSQPQVSIFHPYPFHARKWPMAMKAIRIVVPGNVRAVDTIGQTGAISRDESIFTYLFILFMSHAVAVF